MGSFYKPASRVRVWIGCATKAISDALQLIPKIMTAYSEDEAKIMEERGQSYRVQRNSISHSEESLPNSRSNEDFTSDWEDIYLAQNKIDLWDFDHLESTIIQKEWWETLVRFLERSMALCSVALPRSPNYYFKTLLLQTTVSTELAVVT